MSHRGRAARRFALRAAFVFDVCASVPAAAQSRRRCSRRLGRKTFAVTAVALASLAAIASPPTAAAQLGRECSFTAVEETGAAFLGLAHLVFRVTYAQDELQFGDPVACAPHPKQIGATATFDLDPVGGTLEIALDRPNGLFPDPLVVCTPRADADAEPAPPVAEVLEATDTKGEPVSPAPIVAIDTFECETTTTVPTTVTTVTVTTSTLEITTTTLAAPGVCGDADASGSVSASDALLVLRHAVSSGVVCPPVRCDTNADGAVNTSDALRVLRAAVGIADPLTCP